MVVVELALFASGCILVGFCIGAFVPAWMLSGETPPEK